MSRGEKASLAAQLAGRFISFEGGEGAGKSSQIERLALRLRRLDLDVTLTREPGGSPGAERIRALLLDRATNQFDPLAETLLFWAARQDHLNVTIKPALARGEVVLCDRFVDSTFAYQGAAGKVANETLADLSRIVLNGKLPDATLILDIDPEIGLCRASARRGGEAKIDRFEAEAIGFHRQIRQAFLKIARAAPERCLLIEADQGEAKVEEAIWHALSAHFLAMGAGK